MSEQPLDHVRRPDLPWRVSALTECGKPTRDVKSYIERDALLRRLREWGKQRTSLHTCMTCWETSSRWPEFADKPIAAITREVYGGRADPRFEAELRALAALVLAHREEFDDFLTGLDETISLADHRRIAARRRRA